MSLSSPWVRVVRSCNADVGASPLVLIAAAAIGASVVVATSRVGACEFANSEPWPGVLSGVEEYSGSVPRNVAFVTSRSTPLSLGTTDRWVVAKLDTGEEVAAAEVPGTKVSDSVRVVKPAVPLSENTAIHVFRWGSYSDRYQTSTAIDEVAPSRPEVTAGSVSFHDGTGACQSDSCGDFTSASVELTAACSDDLTSSERLVYVLYLGGSAAEVLTTTNAMSLHLGTEVTYGHSLWQIIDTAWMDRDVYVSVAAIDQAGNLSERSEPSKIHSGDSGGCTVKRHWSKMPFAYGVILAAVILSWLRRWRWV